MSSSHRAPDGSPFRRYFRSASPSGGTQWDPVGPRLHEVPWIERLAAAARALLLVVLCVLVVRPFLSAALWAVVLCTSTWGLFQRLAQAMGNHRSLAALLMKLALTVAIVGPFALVGFSLVEQGSRSRDFGVTGTSSSSPTRDRSDSTE